VVVYVNGERRELSGATSLAELLSALSIPGDRVAIELNAKVIRRSDWPVSILKDDDKVEIVHFVGGGTDPR
jgi:thiamine biosynthesis protein ThiS